MKVKECDIKTLNPYKNNAKIHTRKQIEQIADSIEKFGWAQPIVIDSMGTIIIGHGRYEAAKLLKLKTAPCVTIADLADEEVRMLRLIDNKLNESEWDFDLLADELEGLDFEDLDIDWGLEGLWNNGQPASDPDDTDETYRYTRFWENAEKRIYDGVGKYDIPEIAGTPEIEAVGEFIGFNYALSEKNPWDKAVHFFVDDYQFYRLWTNPDAYLERMAEFQYVFTPDFSVYGNFPFALQIWNHFRKHWIGAYFQENGIRVIPTITWSIPETYDYCFDGEPKESIVATSTVGCMNSKAGRKIVLDGYEEMIKRLNPTGILWNGQVPDELKGEKIIRPFKSFQDKRWSDTYTDENQNIPEAIASFEGV